MFHHEFTGEFGIFDSEPKKPIDPTYKGEYWLVIFVL